MSGSLIPLLAVLTASQDTVPPDMVTFTFKWPTDLRAQVEAQRYQTRLADGRADSSHTKFRFDLVAGPHPSGIVVRSLNFRLDGLSAAGSLPGFAEQLQGLIPSLVVDRVGQVVGLDDMEGFRRAVRHLLNPLIDSVPPAAAKQFRSLVSSLTSEEYLLSKSSEDWNALVGIWHGAEFEVGAVYENEAMEAVPVVPGLKIPYQFEFAVVARAPCTPTDVDTACVVAEMVSYPDPDGIAAVVDALIGQMIAATGKTDVTFDSFEIENTISLLTNPATLVPYSLTVSQSVSGTAQVNGTTAEFGQLRQRSFRYRYDRP